jgi:hypothetical protein
MQTWKEGETTAKTGFFMVTVTEIYTKNISPAYFSTPLVG